MSLTSAVWRRPHPAAAATATVTTAIHVFQERPGFIDLSLPLFRGRASFARRSLGRKRPLGYAGRGQTREPYRGRARVSNASVMLAAMPEREAPAARPRPGRLDLITAALGI